MEGGTTADLRPPTAYTLPDELRHLLAEPWGPIVDTATLERALGPDDVIIAVGDIVSLTVQDLGLTPHVFICDYKTQRGDVDPELQARLGQWGDHEIHVDNPAGEIHGAAWDAVRDGMQRTGTTRIVVEGEEDLLALPCFLEAPDGAFILYGMPNHGVVVCTADAQLKAKVADFIGRLPSH